MELQLLSFRSSRVFGSLCLVFGLLLYMHLPSVESTPTDRLSLLGFKGQIIEDPLGTLSSWNDSLHFCDWQGVTCDSQRERVMVLNLESKSLIGSLSSYVGNLTSLTIINLQDNSFYGEVPQEIGRLISLRSLLLSNNSFEGAIPANISHCSNLRKLELASTKLTGKIPPELGSLPKLVLLNFRSNSLTGSIPPSFSNLSSLQHLTLNFNNLEGSLPDSLGRMPSLQYIRIGVNKFSGIIPPSLWNLSSLVELFIANNQIQGTLPLDLGFTLPNLQNFGIAGNKFSGYIPDSISNISSLDYFDIAKNKFIGPVPTNLGSLKLLKRFDISDNRLGNGKENELKFLTSLINCSNLEVLILNDNHFGGVLPNSIGNFSTKLHSLILGQNQIYGIIPMGIENLIGLTQLSMEQNLFTGSIPLSIGKIHKLKRLNLYGNRLSGQIPLSLGNISYLYELHLDDNHLTGSIPLTLKSFVRLQWLDLSKNKLNGSIPGEVIAQSSFLTYLNLSHNSFTSSLPLEVGSLKNLEVFDVSENKLSREIPSTLGHCTKLERLYMQGNIFHGTLSSFLNKLTAIQYLDLSRNNLSGQIPKDFGDFPILQTLNLSFNNFRGELPLKGVFRNTSAYSIVGNSKLCGGIPELQLPSCLTQESSEREKSLSIMITVVTPIVILSIALITAFLFLYWRRKPRETSSPTYTVCDSCMRLSYEELLKATRGFSQSNLIGAGSFGSVYKGFLHHDQTTVAIKVFKLQQRGASKSFMVECEALKQLRHRNLVSVLTSCSSVDFRGTEFKALVYKFMSNGSLDDWLHQGVDGQKQLKNLSIGQRLNIAIDVASALDYLHNHCQAPFAHCDLKPSNVLLDDDLTAHVGDFGLAKFLSAGPNNSGKDEESSVAILNGSVGYIAPEYGMGGKASTRGDVYSYGILLLEMFTGKRPTDEMFKGNLSLHSLSKMALPNRVMEIVYSRTWEEECVEALSSELENRRDARGVIQECMVSIFKIGIACSAESKVDRMGIKDVVVELSLIRDTYKGLGIHSEKCKC